MRVLVACEFSGIVRDAFRARGHDAWSCDLLPSEADEKWHLVGDALGYIARPLFGEPWDLLIAHPPCTFLANSANKHLYLGGRKANGPDVNRWEEMAWASTFFLSLLAAPVERVAVENPIMGKQARLLIGTRQSQVIQPWQFGHGEIKATCLWLKNLPPLQPTQIVDGRVARVHREPPGPNRWKNRSRTFTGIAAAMAEQWGTL